ncbi:MAG: hypothetical protein H6747_13950 [Deltaproteobacteria bacterium]|nr:hypothetical protein [Deltaproteobacteria bacterium]
MTNSRRFVTTRGVAALLAAGLMATTAPGCKCSSDKQPKAPAPEAPAPKAEAPVAAPTAVTPAEAVAPPEPTTADKRAAEAEEARIALQIVRQPVKTFPPRGFADLGVELPRCIADLKKRLALLDGPLEIDGASPHVGLQFERDGATTIERRRGSPRAIWVRGVQCWTGSPGVFETPCEVEDHGRVAVVAAARALTEETPRILALYGVDERSYWVRLRLTKARRTVQLSCGAQAQALQISTYVEHIFGALDFTAGVALASNEEKIALRKAGGSIGTLAFEQQAVPAGSSLDPRIAQSAYEALRKRLRAAHERCYDAPSPVVRVDASGKLELLAMGCHIANRAVEGPALPEPRPLRYAMSELADKLPKELGVGTWWLGLQTLEEGQLGLLVLPARD